MHDATAERRPAATPSGRAHRRRRWEHESDIELLRCAGDGDEAAWRELHRRYDRLVRSIAARMGCRNATADISQRTWELLVKSVGTVRDPSRVVAWLATTARREAIRELTRRMPVPMDLEAAAPAGQLSSPSPETMVIQQETRRDVCVAVRTLPTAYRTVVNEFLADDTRSYRDIAATLGRPIGSIGPMRGRGLRLLQRQLASASRAV